MNELIMILVEIAVKPLIVMMLYGFCWALSRTFSEEFYGSSLCHSKSLINPVLGYAVWLIPTILFMVVVWYGHLYHYSFLVN